MGADPAAKHAARAQEIADRISKGMGALSPIQRANLAIRIAEEVLAALAEAAAESRAEEHLDPGDPVGPILSQHPDVDAGEPQCTVCREYTGDDHHGWADCALGQAEQAASLRDQLAAATRQREAAEARAAAVAHHLSSLRVRLTNAVDRIRWANTETEARLCESISSVADDLAEEIAALTPGSTQAPPGGEETR